MMQLIVDLILTFAGIFGLLEYETAPIILKAFLITTTGATVLRLNYDMKKFYKKEEKKWNLQ